MSEHWENWSGSVDAAPATVYEPATEAELVEVVERHAPEDTVRAVGAGHSFTRLGETDDVLVSMAELTGVESVDREVGTADGGGRATVLAGTRLEEMNAALADEGLAMENMGDIDQQRLAGALATGTHGTGTDFGVLATQVAELRLVTAGGEVVTLSPGDEGFGAAQVSLGALGLVSAVTLDLLPAYDVEMLKRAVDLEVALEYIEDLLVQNRHAEFFWYPDEDVAKVKTINRTGRTHGPDLPGATLEETETGPSHEVFPSVRDIRFNEMEYGVPAADGPAAMREVSDLVAGRDDVSFPVEYRYVRGDDIPLSPAHGRDAVFIAVHKYHEKPYADFFERAEEIFRSYGGRPHWGKHHNRTAPELSSLYPRWDDFQAVRDSLDPEGVFLNDYVRELFEG
jgi:FAD/FMN-containing dehydrogenase